MAFRFGKIIGTLAPLALSAFDLYRQRKDVAGRPATDPKSLPTRLQELEAAGVEQSRLLTELSRSMEVLAKTTESALEENRRNDLRIRQLVWVSAGLAVISICLSIAALRR